MTAPHKSHRRPTTGRNSAHSPWRRPPSCEVGRGVLTPPCGAGPFVRRHDGAVRTPRPTVSWGSRYGKALLPNRIIPIVFSLLLCSLSFANDGDTSTAFSPKLRNYLTNNPTALKVLTNAISEAFADKTFRLFYFYA